METWTNEILPKLLKIASADAFYQELCKYCAEKQTAYDQIVSKLPQQEAEQIEDYIASCEDLEYRMTQLAYDLGFASRDDR